MIIRSGAHKDRSDAKDYQLLFEALDETKAHKIIPGRKFGNLEYPLNLLNLEKFDKARFIDGLRRK